MYKLAPLGRVHNASHTLAGIHVAVGSACAAWVYVETDAGLLFTTDPATSTGNVERNTHQIADFEKLNVRSRFNDLSSDLVAEHHTGSAAAHHVLIGAADVR